MTHAISVRWKARLIFSLCFSCSLAWPPAADAAPTGKRAAKSRAVSAPRRPASRSPKPAPTRSNAARATGAPNRSAKLPQPESAQGRRAELSEHVARVVSVNGRVLSGEKTLKPGDAIGEGDSIRTEKNSGVKLLLPEQTVVDAGSSTTLAVATTPNLDSPANPNSEVRLDFGTVRASIQKKLDKKSKFLIRTKSSVLSARGTEFSVKSTLEGNVLREQFVVGDGKVEVSPTSGASFVLNPGQQATGFGQMVGGQFRAPASNSFQTQNISTQQVQDSLKSATVVDQTFSQAVVLAKNSESGGFGGQNTLASVAPALAKPQLKGDDSASVLTAPPVLSRLREFAGSQAEQRLKGVKVTVIFDP